MMPVSSRPGRFDLATCNHGTGRTALTWIKRYAQASGLDLDGVRRSVPEAGNGMLGLGTIIQ
jgi:hypothetical protein